MEEHGLRVGTTSATTLATRAFARLFIALIMSGGLLFGAAGTLAWGRAWTHLGLWIVTSITNIAALLNKNPAELSVRMERQPGAKFELVMLTLFVFAVLAIPVVAGLDAVRYRPMPVVW